MRMNTFENISVANQLANYLRCAAAFVQRPDEVHYGQLDDCFRELRTSQQQHWPRGKRAVDDLGAAGCDLVNDPQSAALLTAHERAASAVLDALAPALA